MADIRSVRPIADNKVRNFSSLPKTPDTLHITTPTREIGQSWKLFLASRSCNEVYQSAQMNSQQGMEIKKPPDVFNISAHGNETDETKQMVGKEKVIFSQRNKQSSPLVRAATVSVLKEGTITTDTKSPSWAFCGKISPEMKSETGHGPSTQASCKPYELDKDPLSGSITDMKTFDKCPVMQLCKTFGLAGDNSLVDVHDEELDQIPEVQNPAGLFSSSAKQQDNDPFNKPDNEIRHDQPHPDLKAEPAGIRYHQKTPGPIFKRSISSFDFEKREYTSFFGSLQKKGLQLAEEIEEDRASPDYDFSTLWNMRKAWMFESSFHRTQSVDSFMHSNKKRKTPKERLNSNDGETDDEEIRSDDDSDVATRDISRSCDRLKIRRGALAQPERMIISQAIREKVEKDVEKRKTSMVRRVSQFFNVQLGLNREEDLI